MERIEIMRLILLYDLDFTSEKSKKQYTKFHKTIVRRGFMMIQYSVYMRVVNSESSAKNEINALKKSIPHNGNVRILKVTDLQYSKMIFLRGNKKINETINTDNRYIKINFEE